MIIDRFSSADQSRLSLSYIFIFHLLTLRTDLVMYYVKKHYNIWHPRENAVSSLSTISTWILSAMGDRFYARSIYERFTNNNETMIAMFVNAILVIDNMTSSVLQRPLYRRIRKWAIRAFTVNKSKSVRITFTNPVASFCSTGCT